MSPAPHRAPIGDVAGPLEVASPTLDAIAADVAIVQGLPRTTLEALALRALTVHAAITTALIGMTADVPRSENADADGLQLLTVPQVAKLLAVPAAHIYELCRQREVPTVPIGRYVRIPAGALREWLAERRVDKASLHVRQFLKAQGR